MYHQLYGINIIGLRFFTVNGKVECRADIESAIYLNFLSERMKSKARRKNIVNILKEYSPWIVHIIFFPDSTAANI